MGVAAVVGALAVNAKVEHDNAKKARRAQDRRAKQAQADAVASDIQARRAEVFAETEGQGQGTVGTIRSGIATEIEEDEDIQIRQGKSTPATPKSSLRI